MEEITVLKQLFSKQWTISCLISTSCRLSSLCCLSQCSFRYRLSQHSAHRSSSKIGLNGTGHSQWISFGERVSDNFNMRYFVPQGSCRGLLRFTVCASALLVVFGNWHPQLFMASCRKASLRQPYMGSDTSSVGNFCVFLIGGKICFTIWLVRPRAQFCWKAI